MSSVATVRSLRSQVLEYRAQLGLSLRVTIAALLGFALSHLLSFSLPLWMVLTAVILTQLTFGRSVKATLDYLVGTVGGAVYAGAIAVLVPPPNDVTLAGFWPSRCRRWPCWERSFPASAPQHRRRVGAPGSQIRAREADQIRSRPCAGGHARRHHRIGSAASGLPARAYSLAIEAAARTLDLMAGSLPELFAGFVRPRDAAAIVRIQDNIGGAVRL
jgi:hypothetical protein